MELFTPSCLKFLFYSLVILFLILTRANSQSQLHDQEHATLLKIKQSLENPSFLSHWTSSNFSYCSWKEITCNTGSVTGLTLANGNIDQTIPSFICDLKNLTHVDFNNNFIPGEFPTSLNNCSKLEYLDLSMNNFVGSIPHDIDRLHNNWTLLNKLKEFYMFDSNLVGQIPETIGDMVALEILDISQNSLSGQIPKGLFLLKNLSIMFLSRNKLSGALPDVVEALNLTIIDLTQNGISGKIPDGFGKLRKLTGLALSLNNLQGELPQSLGLLPSLIDFKVFSNNLSGTLPPDFGRSSMLKTFMISTNTFSGKLPENLCYNGHLLNISVYENYLSGELPQSLGNCSSLMDLKIYSNEFSGSIPSGLWTFNLSNFMVSYNKFTGELPERLSPTISRLEIDHNEFYGRIPTGVSSWTTVVVFKASKNHLNGSIPKELTSLPKLTTLWLDHNQFTGPLPSDIVSWKSLALLNLGQNQLSGHIPDSIGLLPVLSELDLSENQLSGEIPSVLPRLTILNLSSNYLTGRVPSELENSAFARSFLNNSGLCADTPTLNLRLTFTESNIVSSLTEHNIIGSGGYGAVYRVAVDGLGYVAVKKIWENKKLDKNLETSFHTEVKILSNIRHRNIVKLMCCISNEDSMLLVYEYVENRSLDRWLHRKNKSSAVSGSVHHVVLDWPKRVHIAIGAAQGLSYMHHDCSPPIVHRDVKTSNILLDAQFNAKVADFGLARMLMKPGELATMSSVIGSFGYMAPEYVQTTRVSEKIDVFSFGVILLELTTGKQANYGDEHSSLAEWAWRHHQLGSNIEELLDKEVMETSYLDGMSSQSHSLLYDQEHAVLLKIKQYLQNPPFLQHWTPSNSSHCSWEEIRCTNGSVTALTMFNTNITQKLPTFLCDLTNLKHIDFQFNYIPGEFPTSLYNCSKLEYLDLSQNFFVGKIPDDIDHLANLQFLNLGGNNFSGDIPASIGRLKELRTLQLYQCLFNGTFPAEIGNLSNLEYLYVFSTSMLSPTKLPSSLTQLNKLKVFHMYESNLVGEIPEAIGNMVALEELDLSKNGLSGQIPSGLFMLKNLSVLYLYSNSLSGEIPGVVEAFSLTDLDLSDNSLSGKIPDDFGKLNNLTHLSLSMNQLSGKVPESIGHLPNLTDFVVFLNNLSGTLPLDFGRFSKLETFQVASNSFTGRMPENLCYCGRLVGLTAYDNNLSGELPESLGSCNSLQYLRVENNELSGNIPSGLWTSMNLETLMINENKFTEHNIIGSGGYGEVYRVAVDDLGYVAVKKIWGSRTLEQKLVSSFLAEVEILSNIRHKNIVKLLCCISNEDSLLLVYEYLENHSLDRWLHKKSKTSPVSGSVLDWPKRLHIAIGAAQGLCYMHHDCLSPVVHRDVKTSNILLDSQFNAKVADFGLAKMLMKPEEFATMSAVAGTFGYIAPEYAQTTRVNEKIDVYSFGVILLELTTGKEANHGDEYSSLAEWAWRHIQVGTDVEDILDEEIKEACYIDEMCNIFKLGVMCTATLPASRPSMKEVLKILLSCSNPLTNGEKKAGFNDAVPLLENSNWEKQVEFYSDDD
uniref:non-specific serine/threonine protein kinase n=1 Tax=Cajanus cajan TaxID=3821 RepID=A0A151T2Y4_CAJCA|nr:LRR receptor-like serine/threonine-protein kinase HSL2 [Cajanus cajan]